MSGSEDTRLDRREFIQTGAVVGASALVVGHAGEAAADDAGSKPLPTRKLGRTGVDVSMLNLGTWRSSGLDRLLRFAWANGIRYYDAAKSYGSEPGIAKWLQAMPEVRKQIFLVTKDHPHDPADLIPQLDQRLEALQTDYIDLLFIHGIGAGYPASSMNWPKSPELKSVIEKMKKSGKVKFVGFSCHDAKRAEYLEAAAEGGFLDALMIQNTAWLDPNTRLNKAIDACHKAGIGLISMKQIAGPNPEDFLSQVPKHAPELIEKGLKPYQALLHAIWSDERFASVCVSMRNTEQVRENVDAARKFTPIAQASIEGLRNAFLASRPSLCPDCDGRCSLAAGTKAKLGDITRYLTYFERHGFRGEARRYFADLDAEARDWKDADLAKAQEACHNHLDFAALLPRVEEHLA
ncbi:MAG: aldo/keto reductase [Isosphaeraceae bacterium]|nr:aldo/keto reductase [Isosphaeraceae bacterium]